MPAQTYQPFLDRPLHRNLGLLHHLPPLKVMKLIYLLEPSHIAELTMRFPPPRLLAGASATEADRYRRLGVGWIPKATIGTS
jgi:hypothetical protein